MNLISLYEAYGLIIAIGLFVVAYLLVHFKYIRHHELHKRFLAALWKAMQNTIHGQHIRTLGYEHEKEQKPKGEQ
ncbi:hypothetical protein [Vibrio profundi]|uniref:hypothetical protein n=1 Tax=Vibrio profundi TaxID=1774960 RepID=UPI00373637D7